MLLFPRKVQIALAAIAGLLGLALLLGPAADLSEAGNCSGASTPAFKMDRSDAERVVLCLVNRVRESHGAKPLKVDDKQQRAAREHNRLMVSKRCFSHQCSGEPDLVGRLEDSGYLPCDCTWSVGENLAWGSGGTASPEKIVSAWMNSAPHRANILNEGFDEAGVGIHAGSPAGDGGAATFTMDFGSKR